MTAASGNTAKMNEDGIAPVVRQPDHRLNPPLSDVGQQWDKNHGMSLKRADVPLHGSPMTAAALSLLGAGSPYRSDPYADTETNISQGGTMHG